MNNLIIKIFKFITNTLYFLKIVSLLIIIAVLLNWVQSLLATTWSWATIPNFLAAPFVEIGKMFTDKSLNIFGVVFEYKFFVAVIVLIVLYHVVNILIRINHFVLSFYHDTRLLISGNQEKQFNKKLQREQQKEQKVLKNYKLYIETFVKKNVFQKVDLDEQNKIMNKFLIKNIATMPKPYNNGIVFSLYDFDNIDEILSYLYQLIDSKAPIDYQICIQISAPDEVETMDNLNKLIRLNIKNKITILADTVWRYKYVENAKNQSALIGTFQENDTTFEVHEFIR